MTLEAKTINAYKINKKQLADISEARFAGAEPDLNTKALLLMLQQLSSKVRALEAINHERLKKAER